MANAENLPLSMADFPHNTPITLPTAGRPSRGKTMIIETKITPAGMRYHHPLGIEDGRCNAGSRRKIILQLL